MNEEKKCCRCNQVKPLDAFVKDMRAADHRKGFCKDCHNEKCQEWRDNNQKFNQAVQKASYWKQKAKALEAQIKEPGLYGIEGLSRIEDGLKNL
jgi:hypothetical protein